MQDVRRLLGVKSIHWKVKQMSLQRFGHVMRMAIDRPTKKAILGWLPALETNPRNRKKTRNTPQYWRRLLREAGINPTVLDRLTENRKTAGHNSQTDGAPRQLGEESRPLKRWNNRKPTNRIVELQKRPLACPHCQKECGNAGGLGIHIKRMHGKSEALFKCTGCNIPFKSEATRKNHERICTGEKMMGTSKKCQTCQKVVTATNFARHREMCSSNQTCPQEPARVYRPKNVPCPGCQNPISATNLARHRRIRCSSINYLATKVLNAVQRGCRGQEESVPSEKGESYQSQRQNH